MSEGLKILLTVALLLVNGLFVAAEFALVSARRSIVEPLADSGSRPARVTLRGMRRVSLMLAGAQLGITVCSLALGSLSEPAIAHLLEPVFGWVHVPEAAVHPISFVIALALVTVLHVVIGEMVPKNIALAAPERAALVLTPLLTVVVVALKPVIWALNALSDLALRSVGVTPRGEVASTFTRDELAGLVDESHRYGLLGEDERDLLSGAIAFADRTAADVTTPVGEVHTVTPAITPDELETLSVQTGWSRFPLADWSGYLHVKDVLTTVERTGPVPASAVRLLPRVDSTLPLREVLEAMRGAGTHLVAGQQDGQVTGVIAMEDVLGELIEADDLSTAGS